MARRKLRVRAGGRSKWQWFALIVVLALAVDTAVGLLTAHHPTRPKQAPISAITTAMTSQSSDFWQRLDSKQRLELAVRCRSQIAAQTRTPDGDGGGNSTADVLSLSARQLDTG